MGTTNAGSAAETAPPPLAGVLETALYVDDMARARGFYEGVLGLSPMFADARLTAYPVGGRSALLLFLRGSTEQVVTLPRGMGEIPPHGGAGPLHCALAIAAEDLPGWEARLAARGVAVEARSHWPRGSVSIYFRDPDGHLMELATPRLWPVW
jgi:catechol 2,3-dioxygenase-like lactoylglutathione lyase family enzyme